MPYYENVFLARQDVSAQQVTTLTETFVNVVKENGGDVPKTEYCGLRSLAYRIKKNRKAHYVLLNIDASPAALAELERNMRINEDVIRFLSVRVDELEEGPSALMRSKSSRDDRRRDGREGRGGRDGPRRSASAEEKAGEKAEAKRREEGDVETATKPGRGSRASESEGESA